MSQRCDGGEVPLTLYDILSRRAGCMGACVQSTTFTPLWIISCLPHCPASLFLWGTVSKIFIVCPGNLSHDRQTFVMRCAHLPLLGWLAFILRATLRLHFNTNSQFITFLSNTKEKFTGKKKRMKYSVKHNYSVIRAMISCYAELHAAQYVLSLPVLGLHYHLNTW